jgi:mono/diheme cytochrome c family protein
MYESAQVAPANYQESPMKLISLFLAGVVATFALPALAAAPAGNADAGRDLVMRSCISCHAQETSKAATDGAPPFSFVAKDNKQNPAWIRGWLMDPHPPMPGIMLSRKQIDDIIAYLNTLPTS